MLARVSGAIRSGSLCVNAGQPKPYPAQVSGAAVSPAESAAEKLTDSLRLQPTARGLTCTAEPRKRILLAASIGRIVESRSANAGSLLKTSWQTWANDR